MLSRILSVDDNAFNLRILEERLGSDGFQVFSTRSSLDAMALAERVGPDVILLDVMMPHINGIELCRQLKTNGRTAHIPVIMLTVLDDSEVLVKAIDAGADDFMTKPADDLALKCRVRNLTWLKKIRDDLNQLQQTGAGPDLVLDATSIKGVEAPANALLIERRDGVHLQIHKTLSLAHHLDWVKTAASATRELERAPYDLVILGLDDQEYDPVTLCSELRSDDRLRNIPLLAVSRAPAHLLLQRALDAGLNDFVSLPIDRSDLAIRCHNLIRRHRALEALKRATDRVRNLATRDGLTNALNRNMLNELSSRIIEDAVQKASELSVALFDIDFFKKVNDTYGHDAGDAVLKRFAAAIDANIRTTDLLFRVGGEEFMLLLAGTDLNAAYRIAERLRVIIATTPIELPGRSEAISITSSLGVATLEGEDDTLDAIMKRADQALYGAKHGGRNKVMVRRRDPLH